LYPPAAKFVEFSQRSNAKRKKASIEAFSTKLLLTFWAFAWYIIPYFQRVSKLHGCGEMPSNRSVSIKTFRTGAMSFTSSPAKINPALRQSNRMIPRSIRRENRLKRSL